MLLLFVLTATGHISGKLFDIYDVGLGYNSLMHLLGGALAGSMGVTVARMLGWKKEFFWALFAALLAGMLWELKQVYLDHSRYPLYDTILDLIMDGLGGWIIGLYGKWEAGK
jgi:VanZ family protein